MVTIPIHAKLGRLLEWCRCQDATDLHGRVERPFSIRVHGRLSWVPVELFPPLDEGEMEEFLAESFPQGILGKIKEGLEVDFSFYSEQDRYRGNFSKQKGSQSFSLRHVPRQKLKLKDLQLPDSLAELADELRGLILVTGPTGQGKSTTLRALIQEINETKAVRIVTVEDPIEHVFEDCLSQFEQREVGIDTASFSDGIRNAMRQDPNVLFVGEIRDRESIYAAMQAAETGHLVLTTLHADSVAQAIARIREFYPVNEQSSVSGLLARNLNAILCQRLVPNLRGSRTPCLELMRKDKGVAEAIQKNDLHLLSGIVEISVNQGMHTFDQYLIELLASGIISREVAEEHAVNRHKLDMMSRGIITTHSILKPDEAR